MNFIPVSSQATPGTFGLPPLKKIKGDLGKSVTCDDHPLYIDLESGGLFEEKRGPLSANLPSSGVEFKL